MRTRMLNVQIVSIPHTGTHFTRDLLKGVCKITRFDHLDSLNFPYWTFENMIVPLRPPKDVAISWGRRHIDYGWDDLWQKVKAIKGHFFFLEDRDKALSKLSEHLNIPLSSNWEKVNFSTIESVPIITEEQVSVAEEIYNSLREQHG
ncbi:MAG: hypothetical protein IH932_04175 [Thaumarchaeota archaeon]|nr:hypothetical protein [Nitrososphaerota archaeon]